ncbi:SEC-C motif-containing protein [Pseudomonas sp. URMO17WK12:I10]|uniref:HNH endonuclease n=1 Tax=unclassified Pseudomonas TaxID=196821 RepID=UPI000534A46F|nr:MULTISPECIES: SEC-C metal-binding domain-containing protein [unclassified Pseudomonas]RDL18518.1 SEC-C motif-containing protein [Pseudomonas sp. LAMO17WK12:I3]RED04076.1 SEC-C motif-containing protein [Pseudomonas sp. URMO17WK12:I10]SOD10266.1 Restriction endonuclease [Pseudomonas sp. URMO17WK12:I9]
MKGVKKNKNGLSRNIPADVQRAVRQRDGFGCVVCGSFFYQYDHIGIEYSDAVTHDPNHIVLLCGGCHDRKTRGMLSSESILKSAANPRCKQNNFSWGVLDVGSEHPVIEMGGVTAYRSKVLLRICGEDMFSLSKPVAPGLPFSVNAKIFDRSGNLIASVHDNQIQLLCTNWDVEVVGQRINIRSGKGIFDVVLRVEPPKKIVIERLQMYYKGIEVSCTEGRDIEFKFNGGVLRTGGGEFDGSDVIYDFDGESIMIGRGGASVIRGLVYTPAQTPTVFDITKLPGFYPKQGRNERCACGSGEKYKHCHGLIR